MKRLTIKGFNFTSDFIASNLQSYPIAEALTKLQEYEDIGLTPEETYKVIKQGVPEWIPKYLEYRNLEEQGRLLELPCRVGDMVWILHHPAKSLPSLECIPFKIGLYDFIGKTVFLTQEEAKSALDGINL